MTERLSFRCPWCNGSQFESRESGESFERHCLGQVYDPRINAYAACRFRWPQADDWQHFVLSFADRSAFDAAQQRLVKGFLRQSKNPVMCQRCGASVPSEQWERHLVDHLRGATPTLSVIDAFERASSQVVVVDLEASADPFVAELWGTLPPKGGGS